MDITILPSADDANFSYQFPAAKEEDFNAPNERFPTAKHNYGPLASNVMRLGEIAPAQLIYMVQNFY